MDTNLVGVDVEPNTIAEIASNVGALGVLSVFVWHLLTKTLPRMQASFTEALESVQAAHRVEFQAWTASIDKLADRVEKNTRVVLGVSIRGVGGDAGSTVELARGAGLPRSAVVSAMRRVVSRARKAGSPDDTQTIIFDAMREVDENARSANPEA